MNDLRAPESRAPVGLVGRHDAFSAGLRATLDGRNVLFAGRPGAGTSALAAAVVDAAAAHGLSVAVLAGAPRTGRPRTAADVPPDPAGGDADVVLVDLGDARPADPAAGVDAVRDGRRTLVAAISEDPLRSDVGLEEPLLELWRSGRAVRIEVPPLDAAGTDALIDLVAAGRAVGALPRALIAQGAAGIPRIVVALTEEVLGGSAAAATASDLLPPPPPLIDLILPVLHRLGPRGRLAFVRARLLDGVEAHRLRRVIHDRCFRELVLMGLIEIDAVTSACHVPSAYRRVADWMDPADEEDRTALAADLLDDAVLRLDLAPQEQKNIAWALVRDSGAIDGVTREERVAIFAGAAIQAALTGRPERAFDYAVMAASLDPGRSAVVDQHREVLERGRPTGPWSRYDEALRGLDADAVGVLAAGALGSGTPAERIDALVALALSDAFLTSGAGLDDRLAELSALCTSPGVARSPEVAFVGHIPAALLSCAFLRALTKTWTPEFETWLRATTADAVSRGHRLHYAPLSAAAGIGAYVRGDFARAAVDLELALASGLPGGGPVTRTVAHVIRGLALHELGRAEEAQVEAAAARAARLRPTDLDDAANALLETVLASGTERSRIEADGLLRRADEVAARAPLLALLLAYQAVRSGADGPTAEEAVRRLADASGLAVATMLVGATRDMSTGAVPRPVGAVGFDQPHVLIEQDEEVGRGPHGTPHISAREREVAELAAEGLGNAAIAARLFLSTRTVESHLYNLRRKLGAVPRREYSRLIAERTRRAR